MKVYGRSIVRSIQLGVLFIALGVAVDTRAEDPINKTTAIAPRVPDKTRVVHVDLSEVTAIAAQKGWFQEEFSKHNAKVDLVATNAYGAAGTIAALFDRGELHIATGMMNGSLHRRANGLDVVFIWQSVNVNPRRAVTLVLADSDVHSVEDLKGKILGSSVTGCPYYAAVESLRSQGVLVDNEWQKGNMRYINITSSAAGTSALLAGHFQAAAWHPTTANTASLYIQNQVRDVATAVPDGVYVTSGGWSATTATKQFVNENPDLVKAYLTVWDRTVRWLYADHGAHLNEAATIVARSLRLSKAVALYTLKDEGQTAYNWGVTDYKDAVQAIKKYIKYQIAYRDPFFTKFQLADKEIEDGLVDKRFYAGGEYFVDVGERRQ